MMRRYLLYVGYSGTRLRGLQKQREACEAEVGSVHGLVEAGLQSINPYRLHNLHFSSRTDKGVHAVCNTAHVDLTRKAGIYDPSYITDSLNWFFKKSQVDIRVRKTVIVPPDFHARYSASGRAYLYRLAVTPHPSTRHFELERFLPLAEIDKLYLIRPPFDVERLKPICRLLEGTHDFATFMKTNDNNPESTVRTITQVNVSPGRPMLDPRHDPLYHRLHLWDVTVHGLGFLYNQVRRIVSVLVAAGAGNLSEAGVKYMLDHPAPTNFVQCGSIDQLAPACGLFLTDVHYPLEALVVGAKYRDLESSPNLEDSFVNSGCDKQYANPEDSFVKSGFDEEYLDLKNDNPEDSFVNSGCDEDYLDLKNANPEDSLVNSGCDEDYLDLKNANPEDSLVNSGCDEEYLDLKNTNSGDSFIEFKHNDDGR